MQKRRLLQMPVVIFPVRCELYIMEKFEGLSYIHLSNFLTSKLTTNQAKQGMTKEGLKKLLLLLMKRKKNVLNMLFTNLLALLQPKQG